MGLFTKSKGEGWSLDKWSGALTISGDLGEARDPFRDIQKKVRSVVALKGARIEKGRFLFNDMENLKSADLSELDVSGCDDLSFMFEGCKSLVSLDLSSWDIRKVQNMSCMFANCLNLRTLRLNGWDVHRVGDMGSLFSNCRNLETLDLTGWHVSKSTKTRKMFNIVPQTADVIANDESVIQLLKESREQKDSGSSDKASTKGNKNDPLDEELQAALDYMEQVELKGKKVSAQVAAVLGDRTPVSEPAAETKPVSEPKPEPKTEPVPASESELVQKPALKMQISGEGWAFDEESGRLTISGDLGDALHPFEIITDKVVSVIALKGAVVRNGSELFLHMSNLTRAELSELDVSKCESIDYMFAGCSSLVSLELMGWDTANISNMGGLFQECESLTSLDLTSWNIANVRDMSFMFFECEALESIKTGPMWIPKNVCDTAEMFECCYSLRELDISEWPSASLESCNTMFWNCESLTELDLSSMDISGIDDISCMFYGCASLRSLKLGGWDTRDVTDMKELFSGCANLETLDLTGWHVNEGADTESMFEEVPQTVRVFADDETVIRLLPEGVRAERHESAETQTEQKSKAEPAWTSKPQPEAKTQPKPVQNPEERFAALREGVKNNDAEATYQLALCCRDGVGTERNEYQYLSLLIRAERLGSKDAVEEMGKVSEDRFYGYGNALYEQKKYKEAFYFYLTAARRGMAQAWYDAGFQLEKGQGMDRDPAKAAQFYEKGAEKGNATAAWSLANMYNNGEDLPKNEAESFRWRLRSAELGNAIAMWAVAVSYFYGDDGAEKNNEQALFWAKKAKESGRLPSDMPIDNLIRDLECNIAFNAALAAQEAGDFNKAIQEYQISAEKGSSSAAWNLAIMYYNGDGVQKDETESFRWRLRSAELGDANAMYYVARGYLYGKDGTSKDYEHALFWAKKAKESGELSADTPIDNLIKNIEEHIADTIVDNAYETGIAAYKAGNYSEAVRQFKIVAEKSSAAAWDPEERRYYDVENGHRRIIFGDSETRLESALYNLGMMYYRGTGVPKDKVKAAEWFKKAATLGEKDAQTIIGQMFLHGEGVPKDKAKAAEWLKKAAAQGDEDAKKILRQYY